MGAIPATEIIAEEGEDFQEDIQQQQSGGGTVHTRLYRLRKSIDRTRKTLVKRGEDEQMEECYFQPNVGRVISKPAKKGDDTGEESEPQPKNGIAISKRLYKQPLAARQYPGKTTEDIELEKNIGELTFVPNTHKQR